MNKPTKWAVGIIIAVAVIAVGYTLYKNPSSTSSKEPIKIGFIGALTGDGASFGETEKNVISLAVDDINKSGGINGQSIEMIYEDGKCNGKDATTAVQKLINIDKVKVILGGTCSAETLAVAPIVEQNKIILFSSFSSNPAITNAGDYIFRNSPSDSDVAKLDAEVIIKKYKKVAIMSENTDYSLGVRDVMKKVFSEKGISVVADETYNGAIPDFRTVLSKIKASDAEMFYINPGTSAKAGGIIVKQARELGIKIPIHGNFSLGTPDALSTGGQYMNGIVISDSTDPTNALKDLLKRYKNNFGKDVVQNFLAGAAWDRAYIIRDALTKVGYDSGKIKDYLYGIKNYNGVLGNYHFDSNGDVVGNFFSEFTLQNGNRVPFQY